MRGQRRFDLAQLNSESANLHLVVGPAHELELAVDPSPHQVAGAIHPGSRNVAERIGDESLGGELRTVQVTTRHPATADVELADHLRQHRLSFLVQDVRPRPADRTANRR